MFWRFGFHNGSAIDSLLDKDDVDLQALLDEDDLLQECKAQNTRLIDYFQRVDVLQRLFGYVTGQIESGGDGEKGGGYKYPYVATEVLCSEIWSIVETCVEHQVQLLLPFWETVLDRPADDMKTQMVMAAHFAKINAVFLNKKPNEMLAFIQSQPSIVERILNHVESPSFVDLLIRIIQLDEQPGGNGVLEWLSSENLMGRLIAMLSPAHTSDIHTVVADLTKNIISMATPSPGPTLTEGLQNQNGPASNRFARELASPANVGALVSYIVAEPTPTITNDDANNNSEGYAASSVVQSIGVVVELIRKNNSDYFEPYLFHTLRNRLIQVQQQTHTQDGSSREALETAMREMVDRMGVVHLGPLLEVMCQQLPSFQRFLRAPRSFNGPVPTTVGLITPLTFERYRICELFAELLHCSNMALLNRPAEFNHLYDAEGRLQGGLAALEELARVIAQNGGDDRDDEGGDATMIEHQDDEDEDMVGSSHELPVSGSSGRDTASSIGSDDEDEMMNDHSDDEVMEEIVMEESPSSPLLPPPSPLPATETPPSTLPSTSASSTPSPHPDSNSGTTPMTTPGQGLSSSHSSLHSRRHSRRVTPNSETTAPQKPLVPVGEQLKRRFLELGVLGTLFDLFFEFPWNNFLHGTIYDLTHQILTGPISSTASNSITKGNGNTSTNAGNGNRELVVALFRDAKLMERILEGQRRNDVECAKPKGVRLGYMGHLTLISEDVITALDRFPPDLQSTLRALAPQPAWDEYVKGRYNETKNRDTRLLGGGKPVVGARGVGGSMGTARWKVDEAELSPSPTTNGSGGGGGVEPVVVGEPRGEFRRTGSVKPQREGSGSGGADFGPVGMQEDEDDESEGGGAVPHFARYLAQEMHSSSDHFESDDEDDDNDGGWLSQSTFELGEPPLSARTTGAVRRPLSRSGFDDNFDRMEDEHMESSIVIDDPFGSDDDGTFGPFSSSSSGPSSSSSSSVPDSDPFNVFPAGSRTFEKAVFDSFTDFGEFGDFQSASAVSGSDGEDGDGELTPTTGSWTFEGAGSSSSSGSASDWEKSGGENRSRK